MGKTYKVRNSKKSVKKTAKKFSAQKFEKVKNTVFNLGKKEDEGKI